MQEVCFPSLVQSHDEAHQGSESNVPASASYPSHFFALRLGSLKDVRFTIVTTLSQEQVHDWRG
jgi:hypothetical protein